MKMEDIAHEDTTYRIYDVICLIIFVYIEGRKTSFNAQLKSYVAHDEGISDRGNLRL